MKLGSTQINQLYLGSTEVNKAYLGSTLVFDTTEESSGYDISNAFYNGVNVSTSAQTSAPQDLCFGDDGAKVYITSSNPDFVYQYNLSTAYDLSTASYASKSFYIGSQETLSRAVYMKSDGTKMYILGNSDYVYQYTLSTPWDVSTASYDSVSFYCNAQETNAMGLYISNAGTKMYILGSSAGEVFQYTMSTPWDVSTASYDSKSFDVTAADGLDLKAYINGVTFSADLSIMLVPTAYGIVFQFDLSTAGDVSTASYNDVSFDFSATDTGPTGAQYNDGGTKLFLSGNGADALYEIDL